MVLKALLLVGGYGTRLRPLTFSKPKPLVEFVNEPISMHQIRALAKVGVKEIILAVSYRSDLLEQELRALVEELGVTIHFSLEDTPLGTAGPIALAKQLLDEKDPDPFFMFNADVTSDYPLEELIEFHKSHGGEGTICVTRVKEPSKYGVVLSDDKGQIERFVEKPQEWVGDRINAGMYIFSKKIISRIELKPTSIEKEIFPALVADGTLFSMLVRGYWMDIGQPKDYLIGQALHLRWLQKNNRELASGSTIEGNVVIHPTARVGNHCLIGPDVVVGPDCVIGDGVRVRNSTLFKGVCIGSGAFIDGAIIGWRSKIGVWCRLEDGCVLGEGVTVPDERFMKGTTVCPHKTVKENCYQVGKIVL